VDVAFDLVARAAPLFTFLELQRVIVDVALRHIDEVDLASEAAVIPPVGLERGNGVGRRESSTATTTKFLPSGCKAAVTSQSKGVKPPSWLQTYTSFTKT
jgi:hypothetical protein